jgi:hypothetical protein
MSSSTEPPQRTIRCWKSRESVCVMRSIWRPLGCSDGPALYTSCARAASDTSAGLPSRETATELAPATSLDGDHARPEADALAIAETLAFLAPVPAPALPGFALVAIAEKAVD